MLFPYSYYGAQWILQFEVGGSGVGVGLLLSPLSLSLHALNKKTLLLSSTKRKFRILLSVKIFVQIVNTI